MNKTKYIILTLLMVLATSASAKKVQVPHVYMFGFSASFQDSTVYFTDIQDVQGAWIDKKTKFLLGRDNYSYQLSNYFNEQGQANRVCMVIFSTSKSKTEKKYIKLRKKYMAPDKKSKKKGKETILTPYDIRYITQQDFKFTPVDMSE
jgi:hypothetical protein